MSEVIKIKASEETFDVSTNTLDAVLKVKLKFDGFYDSDMSRMQRNVVNTIEDKIVEIVTDRYMMEFSDEVIKKIDLEAIVKRVQLSVVRKVSP